MAGKMSAALGILYVAVQIFAGVIAAFSFTLLYDNGKGVRTYIFLLSTEVGPTLTPPKIFSSRSRSLSQAVLLSLIFFLEKHRFQRHARTDYVHIEREREKREIQSAPNEAHNFNAMHALTIHLYTYIIYIYTEIQFGPNEKHKFNATHALICEFLYTFMLVFTGVYNTA
jgi:hypothetical protein